MKGAVKASFNKPNVLFVHKRHALPQQQKPDLFCYTKARLTCKKFYI